MVSQSKEAGIEPVGVEEDDRQLQRIVCRERSTRRSGATELPTQVSFTPSKLYRPDCILSFSLSFSPFIIICSDSGLSEDLNRIVKKPYIEQPDSDGRPDRELADIWWANHLKRELSVIVALFTGQFKSTLTCGECGYASARFEPFTVLQVLETSNFVDSFILLFDLFFSVGVA
jgi:hypothetical protein